MAAPGFARRRQWSMNGFVCRYWQFDTAMLTDVPGVAPAVTVFGDVNVVVQVWAGLLPTEPSASTT